MPPSSAAAATFTARQAALAAWLKEEGIAACVIEDGEGARTSSLRWLCAHPMDAVLFVFATGKTVLVPWDITMAEERAVADELVPSAEFHRSFKETMVGTLGKNGVRDGARVELGARTPHLRWQDLSAALPGVEVVLRAEGLDAWLDRRRVVKDAAEIAAVEKAATITNALLDTIITRLQAPGGADGLREVDMAQLIEREALARGAEGTAFETIAAGPGRSWAIHTFPSFTAGPFAAPGLSILDFGVKADGYQSDVTLTVARGRLSAHQERMIALVEQAYAAALAAVQPGVSPQEPARAVDAVFSAAGWTMPHSLGHGTGLDTHEAPLLRSLGDPSDPALLSGMVFTIEPGLYHPAHGGVRWENDVLMMEKEARVLTRSRIVRIG